MKFLWVFDYDAYQTLPVIIAALFALGGSGQKVIRRVLIPALCGASILSLGFPLIQATALAFMLFVNLSFPYGDSAREEAGILYNPYLFILGSLWSASFGSLAFYLKKPYLLILGMLMTSLTFGFLTILSQKKGLPWKIVEMAAGFAIGLQLALLLS